MPQRVCSKRELLDRWRRIEESEEDDDAHPSSHPSIYQAKEEWFSDSFNFLISLPMESHIWCSSPDIMSRLLETFHNYPNDKRADSPLKLFWKRIRQELRQCTRCICQYHQAKDSYCAEYEPDTVAPLLEVLQHLDEERVSEHLKEMNARIARGEYDSEDHSAEVVSLMFEVLTFPSFFNHQSLVDEFQNFIEAVEKHHEVALAGSQHYPGVYALLFLSGRAHAIGFRLATYLGKIRKATDLEPLQPVLRKYIGILETESLSTTSDISRSRLQNERINVWRGMKTLLGFLEAPAFEEGILEKYPIFLSIVLNHVSDDTAEFSFAVSCLRLSFEMLGCKLWMRTSLSPSMIRNTLLGQCFHTRVEKSHKEIFDLFLPFLQSIEALQDGEHEKQRRHFLYFLLHQVTRSSNFSYLMRKTARKISLLIVHRGYTMNPPCPPSECAHMWGPALVSSLKDTSLHNSLRQPAFDLIQTIIVSDAAALISLMLKTHAITDPRTHVAYSEEEDDLLLHDVEEKDVCIWSEFSNQSKVISPECKEWMCIPMLWFDILTEVDPSVLPVSFSKALFWAVSHIFENDPVSKESPCSIRDWILSNAGGISSSLGWQVPNGSDDGGDGKESRNPVKASLMLVPLKRMFRRLAAHFCDRWEQSKLQKQWTWEPRMSESLILMLVDPNDVIRKAGKILLEHVSNSQGLSSGLQFLCSSSSSLSAMYDGLRHAINQVCGRSFLSTFHNLHHLFFISRKLLKEVVTSVPQPSNGPLMDPKDKFLCEGGFLRMPSFEQSPTASSEHSPVVIDTEKWEKFSLLLSKIIWPCMLKCIEEGKEVFNNKNCQMTCIRLLEAVPVIFERLVLSKSNLHRRSASVVSSVFDYIWLRELINWGNSSLPVIIRHWKQCVRSLLGAFRSSNNDAVSSEVGAIEIIISQEKVAFDQLRQKITQLSMLLTKDFACSRSETIPKENPVISENIREFKISSLKTHYSEEKDLHINIMPPKSHLDQVVVLSDEEENFVSEKLATASSNRSAKCRIAEALSGTKEVVHDGDMEPFSNTLSRTLKPFPSRVFGKKTQPSSADQDNDASSYNKLASQVGSSTCLTSRDSIVLERGELNPDDGSGTIVSGKSNTFGKEVRSQSMNQTLQSSHLVTHVTNLNSEKELATIKELICDDADDPLEHAPERSSRVSGLSKLNASGPKRKVIHLEMPNNKSSAITKLDAGSGRFKPPRLDEWYKPILEIDYFSVVGLSTVSLDKAARPSILREVPLCFQSSDHYIDIFRPLILEEFKAQLHSSFAEMSADDMCCGSLSILSIERIDEFHILRGRPDEDESSARGCSENDLVLLTKEPFKNLAQDVHVLGKVERRERSDKSRLTVLVIRLFLTSSSMRLHKVRSLLTERSKWFICRAMNITPQLREFQALSSVHVIPMLPVILDPINYSVGYSESGKAELDKLAEPLQNTLISSFNNSQLEAVSTAIKAQCRGRTFQLSLIQGPPGTGKTRTIVAIVSALIALRTLPRNCQNLSSPSSASYSTSSITRTKIGQSAAIARAWQDAALAKQLSRSTESYSYRSTERPARGRVLICAQSNAAVDELVSRICGGLYGHDGKYYKPYLVRVGNFKTVHPSSLPFFIDTLVEERLAEQTTDHSESKEDKLIESSSSLRAKLEKLLDNIRYYESKRAKLNDDDDAKSKPSSDGGCSKEDDSVKHSDAGFGAKLNMLYAQKKALSAELGAAYSRERKASEESKAQKHKIRKDILREAEIVVTTLSGCGGDLYGVCCEYASNNRSAYFSEQPLFDAVIIDEAAQALEPATLIPLQLLKSRGTKCVMVGDPKQLPATVLSNVASKFLYECSMFERLQKAGHPVLMLREQYRMHPEISKFPSLHFYENKLLNGSTVQSKSAPFHEDVHLGPYLFFDVIDGQEHHGKNSGNLSLYNEHEVDAAVNILKLLKKRYPSEFSSSKIGIITPYRSQLSVLRSRFSSAFGPNVTSDMEFNTVDGFQGREVDILIFSTVRASESSSGSPTRNSNSIGFVADVRRMNVALTRAKMSLWILGNSQTLQKNDHWASLIQNAKERNMYISFSRPYTSIFGKSSSAREDHDLSSTKSKSSHPPKGEMLKVGALGFEYIRNTAKDTGKRKVALTETNSEAHACGVKEKNELVTSSHHEKIKDKALGSACTSNISEYGGKRKTKLFMEKLEPHSQTVKGKDVRIGDQSSLLNQRCSTEVSSNRKRPLQGSNVKDVREESQKLKTKSDKEEGGKFEATTEMHEKNALQKGAEPGISNRSTLKGSSADGRSTFDGKESQPSNRQYGSTDVMASRKRQREDVAALLSSGFISSKKPEIPSKTTTRRALPDPSAKVIFKPSKFRKGSGGNI